MRRELSTTWIIAAICAAYISQASSQQRAQDLAVTSAEDAFGTSVGLQSVGLYSQNDARGFDPQQAGNLRIEGLYFDQETFATSSCMVRETAMRIGIAAQAYSFPSPTGIADFSLRTPGDVQAFSGLASRGPFSGLVVQLEEQLPVQPKILSADFCFAHYQGFLVDLMRHDDSAVYGSTLNWRPNDKTEVIPFWSYIVGGGRQELPAVYTDGTDPLVQFRERDLASQTWTNQGWRMTTLGVVVKGELDSHWQATGGLFHSQENDPWNFEPYLQLNTNGTADSNVDVVPPELANSTSGELRLTGVSVHETWRQQLQFAIRGRDVARSYGGDDDIDFGNIALQDQTQFAQPPILLTARSEDRVRQLDFGVTLDERWQDVGSAAIGILKDDYRRSVEVPLSTPETFHTTPWLLNMRAALQGGPRLIFYGSYTQGLEDSALAPLTAMNRGEPPAAGRTWQIDGGLRYAPDDKLRVIFGAFDIHKPYLNVDSDDVYRPLGRLRNEGLENSWSYTNAGFTVLAGGVWIKPHVNLNIPEPGVVGSVPLGPVPLTLTANVDCAPPQWGPWAASLQWNRLSSRYATSDDRQRLPPLATLAAGVRYQWKLQENSWTLRFDAFNLTNAQGLHISALDWVVPEQGRRFSLTLAADF